MATQTQFRLPELGYQYDALEPKIDQETMKIHHTKHHQGYVDKLNKALEGQTDKASWSLEKLLKQIDSLPKDIQESVRNNGGGHANHSLFWTILKPGGNSKPQGKLAQAIDEAFGSFDKFKENFKSEATGRFGSGWAWLMSSKGKLKISSTPNQDSPLMEGNTPLLGIDVWEHAYYLKYQNKRADWIDAFLEIVNWDVVEENFLKS